MEINWNHPRNMDAALMQIGNEAVLMNKKTGAILICKKAEDRYNEECGPYGLTGGRLDKGEVNILDAAKREFEEELGSSIHYEYHGIIHQYLGVSYGNVPYHLTVHLLLTDDSDVERSDEHESMSWMSIVEICNPDLKMPQSVVEACCIAQGIHANMLNSRVRILWKN